MSNTKTTTTTASAEAPPVAVSPADESAGPASVSLAVAWGSHVGYRRDNNEDGHLADPDRRLFAVADGLGGRPAGEVASALTLEAVSTHVTVAALAGDPIDRVLVDAIDRANDAVLQQAGSDDEHTGMGSTVVVCHVTDDGRAVVLHAGDSRAFLLRERRLARLTIDHVRIRGRRRLLSRYVGRAGGAAPDVTQVVTEPGDRLLLCTDGLTDMLAQDVIAWLLMVPDPQEAVDGLVAAALEAGGGDNVTMVLVDLPAPEGDEAATA